MLCAPALSLAFFLSFFFPFFLKRVAVCFLLSCVTEMFLVPLFGVRVVSCRHTYTVRIAFVTCVLCVAYAVCSLEYKVSHNRFLGVLLLDPPIVVRV